MKPQLQTVVVANHVLAIVPLDQYDELREALEDAADAEEMRRIREDPDEEDIPIEMARRMWNGESAARDRGPSMLSNSSPTRSALESKIWPDADARTVSTAAHSLGIPGAVRDAPVRVLGGSSRQGCGASRRCRCRARPPRPPPPLSSGHGPRKAKAPPERGFRDCLGSMPGRRRHPTSCRPSPPCLPAASPDRRPSSASPPPSPPS